MFHREIGYGIVCALVLSGCVSSPEDIGQDEEAVGGVRYGVDYSFARPSPSSLVAAGFTFAVRYYSNSPSKNLSKSEADALIAAGLDVVNNWEAGATDALGGFSTGVAHATAAQQQAAACGSPATRPIYFSVDFDATPGQQAAINDYMDGVASVIGRDRTGAYGGYYVIKRLFDAGKIKWGWQAYAWSGGQWDSRAQLRQIQNGILNNCCDKDQAMADDFGQWPSPSVCGDGTCSADESKLGCPEDCGPCGTIDASGGTIDNGDECYAAGGPQQYIRHVTDAGDGGNLDWTKTTDDASEANFADWGLNFAAAGQYKLEVYTAAAFAQSKQAKYVVTASGGSTHDVVIDQTAADGWQTLGTFAFDAGGHQSVHLGDNTGEPNAGNIQLVFDAVRITPAGTDPNDPNDPSDPKHSGGCSAGGSTGLLVLLAFAGVRRRRR